MGYNLQKYWITVLYIWNWHNIVNELHFNKKTLSPAVIEGMILCSQFCSLSCSSHYCYWHFQSVQFSRSVMSDSLRPHGLQHARPPCPSPTPGVYSNSCPLSQWCHPTISSSVIPFSSCLQSFPASRSFQMSQLFASGSQSIGVSASTLVLPMNI